MELEVRTEKMKETEEEMVKEFCERYASQLVRKSPKEIINMFLDWQYERFKVRTDAENNVYILYDFKEFEAIMTLNRHIPGAYECIYNFCDKLNNLDPSEFGEYRKKINFKDLLDSVNDVNK